MRHALYSTGSVWSPGFDKHIAKLQRNEGQVMKQSRLMGEEEEHAGKERVNNDKKKDEGGTDRAADPNSKASKAKAKAAAAKAAAGGVAGGPN